MKRLITVSMLCAMSLFIFAAGTSESTGTGTVVDRGGPLDAYNPAITATSVKILADGISFAEGEDIYNHIWTRAYKDMLGINFSYSWAVPTAQGEQKMNVAIASNDLPDIIPVNNRQFKQLHEMGILTDMTAIFDEYSSSLTAEMFAIDQGVATSMVSIDGKLMAIPQLQGNKDGPALLWIRTDWLDNLGLKVPVTMAEFEEVARAFTEDDPDGNGQDDTYGFGFEKNLFGGFATLDGFFYGYGAYALGTEWLKDNQGKVYNGLESKGIKGALTQLNRMYKAGHIDPEFAVKDGAKVAELVVSGKLGMFYGQHWLPFWPLQDAVTMNPQADWRPYSLPGTTGKAAQSMVGGSASLFYAVNKKFAYPEAVMKILNLFYAKDLALSDDFEDIYHKLDLPDGGQRPHYQYAAVTAWHPAQNLFIYNGVKDYFEGVNTDKNNMIFWILDNVQQNEQYLSGDIARWSSYMWSGVKGSFSVIDKEWKNNNVLVNAFLGASTETMVAKGATLDKMKLEEFTKIIMGASPVSDYDIFLGNWKKLGGDHITAEVNAWSSPK